jgi:hypothetical protein
MSSPTLHIDDTAPGLDGLAPMQAPDDAGGDGSESTPIPWRPGRLTKGLNRYEVVIATVAVIVLITRLSGGAFTADRIGPERQASAVTPFSRSSAPSAAPTGSPEPSVSPTVTAFPSPSLGRTGATSSSSNSSTAPAGPSEGLGASAVFASLPVPGAPTAISVAGSGEIWVGTDNGPGRGEEGPPALFRLGRDGAILRTYRPTGVEGGITAIVAAASGSVYLLTRAPAGVFVLDPATGATDAYSSIPDVGPCVPPVVITDCDGGVLDQPPTPSAMAFDGRGNLFVADAGQGSIWRIPAGGGDAEQWMTEVGWGSPAGGTGPTGLAFDGAGNLVVVVQATLTEDVGIVYLVAVGDDGQAGERVELARTEAGARPAGVALGVSGRVYLTLSAIGQVLVLGADGKEVGRTPSEPTIDTPVGIAFRGTSLFVTAQAPSDATGGQVIRLPVGEEGGTVRSP